MPYTYHVIMINFDELFDKINLVRDSEIFYFPIVTLSEHSD